MTKTRWWLRRLLMPVLVTILLASYGWANRPPVVTYSQSDPSRAKVLADVHGCWSSGQPPVPIPGHVVVTRPDGRTVYSARLVGPALDHVFKGAHPRLVVHAFCR